MRTNALSSNESQVVLITGALTGIGRATAAAFAHERARLVVSGRHNEEGNSLAEQLRSLGTEAHFENCDVRYEKEVQELIDKTVARFGHLDVAINNAGTEGTPGPLVDQTAEAYAATFDTNVLGVLLSMKHELRVMLSQQRGAVINVSSTLGQRGAAGASLYTASKHAIDGLTKCAALEVASAGIRVNVVSPGPTDTGLLTRFTQTAENKAALVNGVPLQRMADPKEIAAAIVFLASPKASFITGISMPVDGGKLAR